MTYQEFKDLAGGLQSISTIVAGLVAALWAYRRFVKHRENFALADTTVDITVVGEHAAWWIVELHAYIENRGKVQLHFEDLSFELRALLADDALETDEESGGQVYFPHMLISCPWVPPLRYNVEPGQKSKYTYVARVSKATSYLMLRGKFRYVDRKVTRVFSKVVSLPSNRALSTEGTV